MVNPGCLVMLMDGAEDCQDAYFLAKIEVSNLEDSPETNAQCSALSLIPHQTNQQNIWWFPQIWVPLNHPL